MKKGIFTIAMTLAFTLGAFAADPAQSQKESPAPSKESREQMAKAHEKMASCLRSDATVQVCHEQMHEQCQDMKDGGGCFMMGKGMMRKHKKNHSTHDK